MIATKMLYLRETNQFVYDSLATISTEFLYKNDEKEKGSQENRHA